MYSCIGIRYARLFKASKIRVQIMRFICCLNIAFNLTKTNCTLICLHDFTQESVTALTDHFTDAFLRGAVACVYDVVARLLRSKV